MTLELLTIWTTFVASVLGTELIRRYALRTSMVDVPNHRSSHTVVTPRGGGLALAICILGAILVSAIQLPQQRWTAAGMLGGGIAITLIGWLDDRYELSARLRLGVHFLAAGWMLTCLGGVPFQVAGISLFWPATALAAVYLAWCTNLYNFMDGLDGFAGAQACLAGAAGFLICTWQQDALLANVCLATVGASAGFLVWNWPPAKIFMGDGGSGFLGFLFGALALSGHRHGSFSVIAGTMLIAVFVVDATLTLTRRFLAGEQWSAPHRTHAFQLASQLGASHKAVTSAACVLFAFAGLFGMSLATGQPAASGLAVAFVASLGVIWWQLNRRFAEHQAAVAALDSEGPAKTSPATVGSAAPAPDVRRPAAVTPVLNHTLPGSFEMNPELLLSEATDIASELGYTISRDWLEGCGGGRCVAAGDRWILLDMDMEPADQTRQIMLAIHAEIAPTRALSPEMAAFVDTLRSQHVGRRAA